jgi:uncharacterized NAD(P)/FAD-binding protein YdhS
MIRSAARHAIIVGGGASGVLLAYQLLLNPASDFRVTLIERRSDIGRGLAYHSGNPEHLLNVRAANMSALPNEPDHFWRWLSAHGSNASLRADPYCFVARRIYGDYIASLIEPLMSNGRARHRLSIVQGECIGVTENPADTTVKLADGRRYVGNVAILATGHDTVKSNLTCYADPWAPPSATRVDKDATVLILGTGLTMVDYVLSLLRDGYKGPIVAISRRGLLSMAHRRVDPSRIDEADIPFGASTSRLLRWVRHRIEAHVAEGGDWRSWVDAIRPFTQRLWRELPLPSKRSFLEHVRPWWDVHRHRMAPEVETRITQALAAGRLVLIAARVTGIEPNVGGALIRYRRRGQGEITSLQVGTIVDCTGIVKDPRATTNPVIGSLLDKGLARVDPLQIGIETDTDCALINRDGLPSRRLFAIGPLTRAAFWEITAIPDIRNQCAALAAHLVHSQAEA